MARPKSIAANRTLGAVRDNIAAEMFVYYTSPDHHKGKVPPPKCEWAKNEWLVEQVRREVVQGLKAEEMKRAAEAAYAAEVRRLNS